jgi:ATP-dependent DNA ligase
MLLAVDLIEHDGDDLRDPPLIERKRRLPSNMAQLLSPKNSIRATLGWEDLAPTEALAWVLRLLNAEWLLNA